MKHQGLELREPKWKNLMQKLDMAYYHCSMPMLENVHVALSEVLEVRGGPLHENELWGVLHQIVVAVQDLFLKGTAHKDGIPQQLVTMHSTQCTSMGKILISSCNLDAVKGTSYWCDDMTNAGATATDLDIEMMYVFTIGEALHLCSEFFEPSVELSENQLPKVSSALLSTLQTMRDKDHSLRMRLSELEMVCYTHGSSVVGGTAFSDYVRQLHGEVLGSIPEHDILTQVGKDVSLENQQIVQSTFLEDGDVISDSRRPSIDFVDKNFTYGHRLGFQPYSSPFCEIVTSKCHMNAKQRWKDAVAKIISKKKAEKALKEAESLPNSWKQYKAKDTIFKVYEELTERRKMLELLRMSINIGSSIAFPVDKDNALTKGLKPKTLAELVMLLQCPNKSSTQQRSSVRSKAENRSINSSLSCLRSDTSSRLTEDGRVKTKTNIQTSESIIKTPLYSLDEVALESNNLQYRRIACSEKVVQGPEFVVMSIKPAIPLSLCTNINNMTNKNKKPSCLITVVLLNGCRFDISCDNSVLGRDVHALVTKHLSLPDNYIFGLAFKQDGDFFFVDCREMLVSQVRKGWKFEQFNAHSCNDQISFTLYWRVKFHVKDIPLIRHAGARHQCYLQSRRDILEGRIYCESNKAMDLAGLALQAEFGDFSEEVHDDYFLLEHYLSYNSIMQLDRLATKEKLNELHKSYCGLSKEIAESEFLQEVQELPEYGYHFYKALQNKKCPNSHVWLGIYEMGIDIFEEKDGKKQKSQQYLWQEIYRISYTNTYFCLTPRTESITGRHIRFKFYIMHSAKIQCLFNLTMSHHQFFVRLKSRARASEIFSDDFDDDVNENNPSISVTEDEITSEEYNFHHDYQQQHSLSWQQFAKGARYLGSLVNLRGSAIFCHNSTIRRSYNNNKERSLMPIKPLVLTKYQKEVISGTVDPAKPITRLPTELDTAGEKSVTEQCYMDSSHSENNCKRQKREGSVSSNSKSKTIKLIKEPGIGLGLSITCGNTLDSILFGALIESIKPGGPAQKEGSLKKGDRIICVNGEIVEDVYYLDVVDMIQNSPPNVELIVESQSEDTEQLSEGKENIPNGSKVEFDVSDGNSKIYNHEVNSWNKYKDHSDEDPLKQSCHNCSKTDNRGPPIPKPRKKWSEKLQVQTPNTNEKLSLAQTEGNDQETNKEEKIVTTSTTDSFSPLKLKETKEVLFCRNANGILLENDLINDLDDEVFQKVKNMDFYMNSKNSTQDENEMSDPDNFVRSEQYMPGDIFCVKLKKIEGSFGLNIQPKDMLVPGLVYVSSLVPNGSAEIDGRIRPGDRLLEVNDIKLDSVPYCEAVNILRLSPEITNIVVQKGKSPLLDENCANTTKQVDEILCPNDPNHHESVANSNNKVETNMKKWQVRYKKDFDTKITSSLQPTSTNNILHLDSNKNENCDSAKYTSSCIEQQPHSTIRSNDISVLLPQNSDNACIEDDHASCDTSSGISTGSSSLFTSTHEERNVLSEFSVIGHKSGIEKYTLSAVKNTQNYHIRETIPNKSNDNKNSFINAGNGDLQQSCQNANEEKKDFCYNNCRKESTSPSEDIYSQKITNGLRSPATKEDNGNKANRSTPVIPQRRFRQLRKIEDILKFITAENTYVVHIRKSSRGLGLSICGGRDARGKNCINQLVRIRKLYPLQPAMECEKLQVGDVIIEVNGKSTLGLSHTEALDALRAAPTDVMLKIHHPDPSVIPNLPLSMRDDSCPSFSFESPSSSNTSTLVKSHSVDSLSPMEFEIVLIKREGSLGFTVLKRESDSSVPGLYVKELIREPAKSDGRIRPGDQILQVNGTDISEMSHNDAVNFLRNSSEEVTLKLCRSDPPLSPLSRDDEPHLSKPLRREAVELLTDWARQKKSESPGKKRDRRRVRSKLDDSFSSSHSSSGSHHSSYNHKNNIYTSDSDHNVLSECTSEEELSKDEPGLQRILRPKSLDILNSSNRKKLTLFNSTEDEVGNLYRQTSVALPGTEQQVLSSSPHLNKKSGQGTLLRWRGTTLPKNESSQDSDLPAAMESSASEHSISSIENNPEESLSFPCNIEIIEVSLDRGWHGRLGFSICDPTNNTTEESLLPNSPEVKIVHAGSLAASDGRIRAGDRLMQINKENVEGKAAAEVIDILRKTRGLVTMIFARMKEVE